VADVANADAVVETYTMVYDREGRPARGIVIGRTEEGVRFLSNTPDDLAINERVVADEFVGQSGRVRHIDGANRFEPT
ncbi:MAG: acetyl-CoA acetyltransferase, partial [bacterium]|nr:acetyl-CoA acetyltransferase [bacterium]